MFIYMRTGGNVEKIMIDQGILCNACSQFPVPDYDNLLIH